MNNMKLLQSLDNNIELLQSLDNNIELLLNNNIELLPSDILLTILNKSSYEDIIQLLKINKFFNNFIITNLKYIKPIKYIDNNIYMIDKIDEITNIDNIILQHPKIGLSKNITGLYFYSILYKFVQKYSYYIYKIDFPKFLIYNTYISHIINILSKCNNIKYINFSKLNQLCLSGCNDNLDTVTFRDCYFDFSNCKYLYSLNEINHIRLYNCIIDLTNSTNDFDMNSLEYIVVENCIIKT